MAAATEKKDGDGRDASAATGGDTVAVALAWRPAEDVAPKVVATGRGTLAERIIAAAREADVPVRADPDLAAVLSAIEIDCLIPEAAFVAVAEILRYIYELNGRLANLRPAVEGAGR